MVEFVLVLPFLVTLMFAVVQLGFIFADYLRVTDAARIGARAAAVARFARSEPCAAARTAVPSELADDLRCDGASTPGSPFTVTIEVEHTLDLPLLPFEKDIELTGRSTERIE